VAALLHGDPTPCSQLTSLRGAAVVVSVKRAHSVIHLQQNVNSSIHVAVNISGFMESDERMNDELEWIRKVLVVP
jgi:hypothetical protein